MFYLYIIYHLHWEEFIENCIIAKHIAYFSELLHAYIRFVLQEKKLWNIRNLVLDRFCMAIQIWLLQEYLVPHRLNKFLNFSSKS